MSDLGSSTLKGFQPLGGLSEIWALSKLPPTSRMLRRLGAIGRELAIRLKAVEGSKFGFVGGKSTVTDFLVDVAMRYQSKGLLVAVEKDFIIEEFSAKRKQDIFTLSSINSVEC
ncbi:hypothetical protein BPOR_0196g00100 [Botrytis porri]|uniref:Uncharacterized protein n=1 Tax=Botrytis porri TaxID=87229 RepID=A0A4Z1KTS2_9HELO|nr:hypothetical protein BPOR_0196g00100 [Botrytis porri]